MKKFVSLFVLFCLLLAGCGTGYEKDGTAGGYSDFKLQDNIFDVRFGGNEYTSSERATDFALLRCAEVSLANGYWYFIISEDKSYIKTQSFTTPPKAVTTPLTSHTTGTINSYGNQARYSGNTTYSGGETTYSGGQTTVYHKPQVHYIIQCFKDKPTGSTFVYDATQIRDSLRVRYNLR